MMPSPDHGAGLPHTSQVLTRLRADRTSLVRLCKNGVISTYGGSPPIL